MPAGVDRHAFFARFDRAVAEIAASSHAEAVVVAQGGGYPRVEERTGSWVELWAAYRARIRGMAMRTGTSGSTA